MWALSDLSLKQTWPIAAEVCEFIEPLSWELNLNHISGCNFAAFERASLLTIGLGGLLAITIGLFAATIGVSLWRPVGKCV